MRQLKTVSMENQLTSRSLQHKNLIIPNREVKVTTGRQGASCRQHCFRKDHLKLF
jgi:hypothetical protein